jgi:hypothetical protein
MSSRLLMTTAVAGIAAGALWSETPSVTLRFNLKRGLSLRCWIFGHEDWVRRTPGRLYLECLDCGRETPGWTTARNQPDDAPNRHDRSGSDVILSAAGPSQRPEPPRNHEGEMPRAA